MSSILPFLLLAREPPDLDQLEAEGLDPVDQPVELRLVADRAVEDGLDRLEIARHSFEAVEQRGAEASADADLIAPTGHRWTLTGERVIRPHPTWVSLAHPHAL